MKLTHHSKQRMKERADLNHKERIKMFDSALHKGKSPNDISSKTNKELKEYLLNKCTGRVKVKLYKDYVFIYNLSKKNKTLLTMYKLPDELLERKEK